MLPVETMDLVHEQDRRHATETILVVRLVRNLLDLVHASSAAGKGIEGTLGVQRDDVRNGRLAASRRPTEDDRHRRVLFQKRANHGSGGKQFLVSLTLREGLC